MNKRSIKSFHATFPPRLKYALLITPPYGQADLLNDFGLNPEHWVDQLFDAIETEFKFIPTPSAVYILTEDVPKVSFSPSQPTAFRNVHIITDTQSISEHSIAFLTPFISEPAISFLNDKARFSEYSFIRFQYFAPNNITVHLDVSDYLNAALGTIKTLSTHAIQLSASHTFSREELSRYIIENGILKYLDESNATRVSIDKQSLRGFIQHIEGLDEEWIASKYSIEYDPQTLELSPPPRTRHVIVEGLMTYRDEKYRPILDEFFKQFASNQCVISTELYKDIKLRETLDFVEIDYHAALFNSSLHTAIFLFSLARSNSLLVSFPRALVTKNAFEHLLSSIFIFDSEKLHNDMILKYEYKRFYLYPDFWYDCRGPYINNLDFESLAAEYRNKIATSEVGRLIFERSLEDQDELLAAAYRAMYDPEYKTPITPLTLDDTMEIIDTGKGYERKPELSDAQQDKDILDSQDGMKSEETLKNAAKESEELLNVSRLNETIQTDTNEIEEIRSDHVAKRDADEASGSVHTNVERIHELPPVLTAPTSVDTVLEELRNTVRESMQLYYGIGKRSKGSYLWLIYKYWRRHPEYSAPGRKNSNKFVFETFVKQFGNPFPRWPYEKAKSTYLRKPLNNPPDSGASLGYSEEDDLRWMLAELKNL